MSDLYVSDTVLYVCPKRDVCYVHTKTVERLVLTDGKKHPVTTKKVSKEEMQKLWK